MDDVDLEEGEEEVDEGEKRPVMKKLEKAKTNTNIGTKASKAKSALSAAFSSVPMTNNADDIPSGLYEAILRSAVLQDPDPRGQSIRFVFELCDPKYSEANHIASWRKMLDESGNPVSGGVRAFYQDIAKLGWGKPENEEDLIQILEDLNQEEYGVMIKVGYRKWEGNDYQTVAIMSRCDNEVVQEYRDRNPL